MDEFVGVVNAFDDLMKYNTSLIDAIGDCPNIEMPVNREPIFWRKIGDKGGYECQEHLLFGQYRVVSPSGTRVANGSKSVMLEKMKRLSKKEFLRTGDVIGVSRNGIYEHFAVYIGSGRVIHYAGEGSDFGGTVSVHEADMSEFLKGSKNYFVVWFDHGIPYKIQSETTFLFNGPLDYYTGKFQREKRKTFSARDTVERARSRIGETEYNLVTNNCEHFAMWCKTGTSESSQVKNIARAAAASGVTGYGLEIMDLFL